MTNTTDPHNPHDFTPEVMADIAVTSGKMYNEFYELLATYQFDFSLEEKNWILDKVVGEIKEMNEEAEQNID